MLDWLLAPRYLQWLWDGFLITLALSAAVSAAALLLGVVLCAGRLSRITALRWAVTGWLSFFRNTPLLVQLFFWYFGAAAFLPKSLQSWLNSPHQILGMGWPSFEMLAAFAGLTLYSAAFMAEEFRAGVRAVSPGQITAGAALGLNDSLIWHHIVLPQAVRNAFPALAGQIMNVVKNSSLAMAIGLAELSYASRQVETESFRAFEAFGVATVLYIALIALIEGVTQAVRRQDRRARL